MKDSSIELNEVPRQLLPVYDDARVFCFNGFRVHVLLSYILSFLISLFRSDKFYLVAFFPCGSCRRRRSILIRFE